MATRHRPRRGDAGEEIELGDPFGQYEKQGGAFEGASESGDLQSREFGVPQADIPGGVNHLVNVEAIPAKVAHKGYQPTDYHKYHGVPPTEPDGYSYPEQEGYIAKIPRPVPEPKISDAVPVYIVEQGQGERNPIRKLITEGPQVITGPTTDPIRLADRDVKRLKFWICNETTAGGVGQAGPIIRIGDWETCADGRGMGIPAATLQDFETQDAVYCFVASAVTVTISFGYVTEIEGTG